MPHNTNEIDSYLAGNSENKLSTIIAFARAINDIPIANIPIFFMLLFLMLVILLEQQIFRSLHVCHAFVLLLLLEFLYLVLLRFYGI